MPMYVLLTGIVVAVTLIAFFLATSYFYNTWYKAGVDFGTANAKSNWAVDALNKLMSSAWLSRRGSATTAPAQARTNTFNSHKVGESRTVADSIQEAKKASEPCCGGVPCDKANCTEEQQAQCAKEGTPCTQTSAQVAAQNWVHVWAAPIKSEVTLPATDQNPS